MRYADQHENLRVPAAPPEKERPTDYTWIGLVSIALFTLKSYFVATNPILNVGDITAYQAMYYTAEQCGCLIEGGNSFEYVWPVVVLTSVKLGLSFATFHGFLAFLSLCLWFYVAILVREALGLRGVVGQISTLAATLFLLTWPFVESGLANVLRSALAIPLAFIALFAFSRTSWAKPMLIGLVAVGIQQPVSVALLLGGIAALLLGRTRALVAVALFIGIYSVGLNSFLLRLVGLDSVNVDILSAQERFVGIYDSGVRLDFLLSVVVILGGLIALEKWAQTRPLSDGLLIISIGVSYPFLLLGTVPYADRLLQGLWIFGPLAAIAIILSWRPSLPFGITVVALGLVTWAALNLLLLT